MALSQESFYIKVSMQNSSSVYINILTQSIPRGTLQEHVLVPQVSY